LEVNVIVYHKDRQHISKFPRSSKALWSVRKIR
jgi:hypothetical protein